MEAIKRRFNRENGSFDFEREMAESIDSARNESRLEPPSVRARLSPYKMDLASYPAPFPQLKTLRPRLALAAAPSRCASASPAWLLRKKSHHRRRRQKNQSRRSTTCPPDLTDVLHVHLLIASPCPIPPTPTKTVVRTPILRRLRRCRPHREGATGASARLNSGEPPLVPPPRAAARSEPPISD
jgi:hypothetical protein